MTAPLLALRGLQVRFETDDGSVPAVNGVDLDLQAGECLGLVGESGSGKTQLFLALLDVLPPNGRASGSARFEGIDLLNGPEPERRKLRGARIGMIFQDPMTALTPHMTVGDQIAEMLVVHRHLSPAAANAQALALLDRVRINDPPRRMRQYPHELSGGMRQRVMIAIALACEPALVIADEPTTALDVTVQAELLQLFRELMRDSSTAFVLITHDLGVTAALAQRVAVMYAGRIVELAPVDQLFSAPRHPYTAGLLAATPRLGDPAEADLRGIDGQPPNPRELGAGCPFQPRCTHAQERCARELPVLRNLLSGKGVVACHYPVGLGQSAGSQ